MIIATNSSQESHLLQFFPKCAIIPQEVTHMKLTLSQIRSITLGASRICEAADGIHFYRFTKEQEDFYAGYSEDFYNKTFTSSGICLSFRTNSRKLFIKTDVTIPGTRHYFSFDLMVNGKLADTLHNFDESALPRVYCFEPFPCGEFSKEFILPEGEKDVRLLFPWSAIAVMKEISLDDGASIIPIRPEKKLLAFGDSITHGYDALYPSHKYITRLAEFLNAQEHNKAIGGEVFVPGLSQLKEDYVPDYITVAYGTNDWRWRDDETTLRAATAFYRNLRNNYPNTPIFAIAPIWRDETDGTHLGGDFSDRQKLIENAVSGIDNVTLIPGMELVPHCSDYFADKTLHPNDAGFAFYYENLKKYFKNI